MPLDCVEMGLILGKKALKALKAMMNKAPKMATKAMMSKEYPANSGVWQLLPYETSTVTSILAGESYIVLNTYVVLVTLI